MLQGQAFKAAVQRFTFKAPNELIQKWKCPVRFTSVPVDLKLHNVPINNRSGDYEVEPLRQRLQNETVNSIIVEAWKKHVAGKRKSTMVFGVDQFHSGALTHAFRAQGVEAHELYFSGPKEPRVKLTQKFTEGLFPVLVGTPDMIQQLPMRGVDCVFLAAPTILNLQYAHMVKHGTFISTDATDEKDCLVVEIIDTFHSGAVTANTFFGVKYTLPVEDRTVAQLRNMAVRASIFQPSGTEVPYPYNYLGKSPFAWARCIGNVYIQSFYDGSHIRIEPVNAEEANFERLVFRATHFPPDGTNADNIKLVVENNDLEETIAACDGYVSRMNPQIRNDLRWNASWRREQAQIEDQNAILALPLEYFQDLDNSLLPDKTSKSGIERLVRAMSAGEALDLLARVAKNNQTSNLISSRDQRSIIRRMKEGANPYSFKKKR